MNESQALLAEYVRDGSETAFREIVSRYIDLVYSTAFRLVERDSHLAQDVSQTVLADLARTAPKLASETMLGGWLHRHACFVARNSMNEHKDPSLEIAASAKYISDSLSPSTGFYLVGQNLKSNDLAILDVHFEGEGKTRKFALQRFGNEWKFATIGRAGKPNEDLQSSPAWP